MPTKIIELPMLIDVVKSDRTAIIEFYTTECPYCDKFQKYFDQLSSKYDELDFYKMDVTGSPTIPQRLMFEGVPAVLILNGVSKQKYYFIPEPKNPDDDTWYTKSYVDHYINKYANGVKK